MERFVRNLWRSLGTFRPLTDWLFDKERQNEIYLEAAIRSQRCNAAVRQRRVGQRRRWLAGPKQGRLGIARCQIGFASFWIVAARLRVARSLLRHANHNGAI